MGLAENMGVIAVHMNGRLFPSVDADYQRWLTANPDNSLLHAGRAAQQAPSRWQRS
jgi:hypothetical protein